MLDRFIERKREWARKNPQYLVFLMGLLIAVFVFGISALVFGVPKFAGDFDKQEVNPSTDKPTPTNGVGGLFKGEIIFIPPKKEDLDKRLIIFLENARNNTILVDNEIIKLLGGFQISSFVLTPERRDKAIQLREEVGKLLDDMNAKYNIDSTAVFTESKQVNDIHFLINEIVNQTMKFESLSRILAN